MRTIVYALYARKGKFLLLSQIHILPKSHHQAGLHAESSTLNWLCVEWHLSFLPHCVTPCMSIGPHREIKYPFHFFCAKCKTWEDFTSAGMNRNSVSSRMKSRAHHQRNSIKPTHLITTNHVLVP